MSARMNDPNYLLNEQYKNASNLNARANLHIRFSTNRYGWMRWVFDELMDLPPDARVLELGCGPGGLWNENRSRIPAGWQITLSDFSPGMLEEAQHNLEGAAHAFTFERFDAQSIPTGDGTFDAVIANHMLYHVPDIPKALGEIRRVLKVGGHLFAATNGASHLRELDELSARFWLEQGQTFASVNMQMTFRLDNGYEQLAPFFEEVRVKRYEDTLMVTEVEPLVAYTLSMSSSRPDTNQHITALREFFQREMDYAGAIRISKDPGLFIARR